jgi:phosphoribosylamine-glycine ligase
MVAKRPAKRIVVKEKIAKKPVSNIVLENNRNIAGRIRDLVTRNPDITVIEFISRSRYKNPEAKPIIDILKKEFGDLKSLKN